MLWAEPACWQPPQMLRWQFHCGPSAPSVACVFAQTPHSRGCHCDPWRRWMLSYLLPPLRCH